MNEVRLVDANKLMQMIPVEEYNARMAIANAPTVDAEPVRHGHWIDAYPKIEPNPMFQYGICSVCGYEQSVSKYLKFCPNCGAKMDGVKEDAK